jgi:hypothetical protein
MGNHEYSYFHILDHNLLAWRGRGADEHVIGTYCFAVRHVNSMKQQMEGDTVKKLNFVALVRKQTIPTERLPLVGEVIANFCGQRVPRGHRNGSSRPLISVF